MTHRFKFIDLFAGIGGFHLGMHDNDGECVFASEVDTHARNTYEHNFNKISPKLFENGLFNDDIRAISEQEIPDFDVLCAGFPCQPFSQAGHKRGFDDTHNSERGNLFFNIVDILSVKKPKAFFLENVRGIVKHDNGNTFKVIRDHLENQLGYSFYYKIVKASDYGLPQLRPRVFMVGFKNDVTKNFEFPAAIPLKFTMSDVWGGECSREVGFTLRVGGRGSPITDRRNWDSYWVDGEVKKIMPPQARVMQGFPDDFEFPVANTQAMKQLGNSVAVDAVRACSASVIDYMESLDSYSKTEEKESKNNILDLVNNSNAVNLTFKIDGLNQQDVGELSLVNNEKDIFERIRKINTLGGTFNFHKIEKEIFEYNLQLVDTGLTTLLSDYIYESYTNKNVSLGDYVDSVNDDISTHIMKRFALSITVGSLSGHKWDGDLSINDMLNNSQFDTKLELETFLYENISLEFLSSQRYRFGKLISEPNGSLYFKLNMKFKL